MGLLNGLLFIFIFTSLWKAIYAQSDTATLRGPFDLESIVTYAVLAMVIKIFFSMDDNSTSFKMRTGAMAMDLIKPISYYFFYLAERVGYSLFHVFSRGIPLLAFSLLVFHIRFPTQPWNYLLLLLPFPHILYTPTAVFMGHPPPGGIGSALITQFCWAAILPIFSWLAWKAAIKKLVVQGG